jgi:hypothetical protein
MVVPDSMIEMLRAASRHSQMPPVLHRPRRALDDPPNQEHDRRALSV